MNTVTITETTLSSESHGVNGDDLRREKRSSIYPQGLKLVLSSGVSVVLCWTAVVGAAELTKWIEAFELNNVKLLDFAIV